MTVCTMNPCGRYEDNRCCKECLDDECEFSCNMKEYTPCQYEVKKNGK